MRLPPTPLLSLGFAPLLFVPVWMNAGTFASWQSTFLPLSAWAWLCFWIASPSGSFPSRTNRLFALLRDPACWGALFFVLLLSVQTVNTGRELLFDHDIFAWIYTPPPYPDLPWSFTPHESMEMLRWFIPVFSIFLIARHAPQVLSPSRFWPWLMLNSALTAVVALMHLFAGWYLMYEFWGWGERLGISRNAGRDTYGSFGYPNHGATFFILLFAVSLGFFLRTLLSDRSERHPKKLLMTSILSLLFFLTAQFSASRAGILGVWIVLALIVIYLLIFGWSRAHPVQRLYASCAAILGLVTLIGLFHLFAQPTHLKELAAATRNLDAQKEFDGRWFQIETAWAIWKDHPWFGVGGWGYKYLVGHYLPPEQWGLLGKGRANVHNDFFQFLCEFGLAGMVSLSLVFLPPVLRALPDLRKPAYSLTSFWGDPLRVCCGAGLLVMLAHSMIDLPFRSPAVFAHGALFLLWMGRPDSSFNPVWLEKPDWHALKPLRRR